jgi:hypothetical protein
VVIGCRDCDAVQVACPVLSGRLRCWRCESTLERATGRSLNAALACAAADEFDLVAVIKALFDKLAYTGTRFCNAGAVRLSSAANGLALEFQSFSALVDGAIAFATPFSPAKGQPGKPYTRFNLYTGREQAENAPGLVATTDMIE